MFQAIGPITARLLLQHGEDSPGWWPPRSAKPVPLRSADCGWPVCGRQTTPAGGVDRRTHQSRPGSNAA